MQDAETLIPDISSMKNLAYSRAGLLRREVILNCDENLPEH